MIVKCYAKVSCNSLKSQNSLHVVHKFYYCIRFSIIFILVSSYSLNFKIQFSFMLIRFHIDTISYIKWERVWNDSLVLTRSLTVHSDHTWWCLKIRVCPRLFFTSPSSLTIPSVIITIVWSVYGAKNIYIKCAP